LLKICSEGLALVFAFVCVFAFAIAIFYECGDFQGPEGWRDWEGAQPGKKQDTAFERD
jgi:hypothetical protein